MGQTLAQIFPGLGGRAGLTSLPTLLTTRTLSAPTQGLDYLVPMAGMKTNIKGFALSLAGITVHIGSLGAATGGSWVFGLAVNGVVVGTVAVPYNAPLGFATADLRSAQGNAIGCKPTDVVRLDLITAATGVTTGISDIKAHVLVKVHSLDA